MDNVGSSNQISLSGSVTFDDTILWLMVTSADLIASDSQLGASGTSYSVSNLRGIENLADAISISTDMKTLSVDLAVLNGIDNIRVVTGLAAVPIPAAAWLFGTGLIGLISIPRSQKKTVLALR